MNILLLFFALPIATIILAIVLEKILRCPVLTALTFFAIYLIVAFAAFDASFLIFAIVYVILAFIAAYVAEYFYRRNTGGNRCNMCPNRINQNMTANLDITNGNNNVANTNTCNCRLHTEHQ